MTSFTFDDRHRKFIVGDNSGGIRVYNYSNGAIMKVIGRGGTEEPGI